MTITNTFRWTGKLGSNWNALDPGVQSNWDLLSGNVTPPAYPSGAGDLAVFDLGGAINVTAKSDTGSGVAGAEEIQIAGTTDVTFTSDHFGAGADGSGGLLVDEDSVLTIANGATVSNQGSLDIIGLTGSGTLVAEAGTGFADNGMIVGADEDASGEVSINGAFAFEVAQSGPGAADGVLTIGDAGEGSVDVSGGVLFYSAFATLGAQSTSTGNLTIEDSTWSGSGLTVGGAGTGNATIEAGAIAAFSSISVGPSGDLDVTGAAGSAGQVIVDNFTLDFGTIDVSGGGEVMIGTAAGSADAVAVSGGLPLVGLGTVNSDVVLEHGGMVEAALAIPGALTINGNVTGSGTLEPIMTLEVNGGIDAGVDIVFSPSVGAAVGELVLDVPRANDGTIVGFGVGNTIDIAGSLFSKAVFTQGTSASAGTLTLSGDSTPPLALAVEGTYSPDNFLATPGTTDTVVTLVPCFVAGTHIATEAGEMAVEDLRVGDRVRCLMQGTATIAWIGTGHALVTRGRRNAATPVIVRKGALADNVPHRDLHITKGHSLYLDGALIPVEFLVNHRSILWDDHAQEVAVYHIELDTHDVLLADGAPAESYRDDGNRWLFQNANPGWQKPPQRPCAPVLTGGPLVDAAWRRLLNRAAPRAMPPLTTDADLHLLADGQRLDAVERVGDVYIFRLAAPPSTLHVASRAAVPAELGFARDPRSLGVALRRLVVRQGTRFRVVAADDARLSDGFHAFEAANGYRWTDGDAVLHAELLAGFTGSLELVLHTGGATYYLDDGTVRHAA